MGCVMNCCDEYGNCRQGRDCPVRTTVATDVKAAMKFTAILLCVGAISAVIAFGLGLLFGLASWLVGVV